MGARKKIAADKRKEAMKSVAIARLVSVPTSPRKMRQSADTIRGLEVEKALGILQYSTRHASLPLYKLLRAPSRTGKPRTKARRPVTPSWW